MGKGPNGSRKVRGDGGHAIELYLDSWSLFLYYSRVLFTHFDSLRDYNHECFSLPYINRRLLSLVTCGSRMFRKRHYNQANRTTNRLHLFIHGELKYCRLHSGKYRHLKFPNGSVIRIPQLKPIKRRLDRHE